MQADIRVDGDRFYVKTRYSPVLVDAFRAVAGRTWDGVKKEDSFPIRRDSVLSVCDAIGVLPQMLPDPLRRVCRSPEEDLQTVALDGRIADEQVGTWYTQPFDHQRRNVARLLQNPRWLLCDEMGTGKTLAVVCRLRVLLSENQHARIVVICPKSVTTVWPDELAKHGDLRCKVIDSQKDEQGAILGGVGLFVIGYERFLSLGESFAEADCVILDEIHRVKSFTAKTSQLVRKLTARAKYVWGLSGTPAPNGLQDWFGVLAAIDPSMLPVNTKTAFEARYCIKRKIEGGPFIISGYKNVEELHGYVSRISSRVTKAECLDLPEKIYSTRRVALEGEQARIYKELKKDAIARINALNKKCGQIFDETTEFDPGERRDAVHLTVKNILSESLRLLQVVGGFVPDDSGTVHELDHKAKLSPLAEVLDEAAGRQAVIWCAFKSEVAFLAKWLAKNYGPAAIFTGDTSSRDRQSAIDSFRNGEARFFVGTASAGGSGINGLAICDLEVYYSRNWSLTDYLQSQDRLHRIGQKNNVHIVKIIATATVDERVDECLEKKTSLQEMMLSAPERLL